MSIETFRINYWKEVSMNLDRLLKEARGVIFLIHNSAEIEDIVEFLNRFRADEEIDVLYISLIRSFYHIKLSLEEKTLPKKRLFIVDCVSSMIMEIEERSFEGKDKIEGIFRKTPSTFSELENLIGEAIKSLRRIGIVVDMILIDSISQYINLSFPTESEIRSFYRFLDKLKNILGIMTSVAVVLYEDKTGSIGYLPIVHADQNFRMEVVRYKPRWRG